MKKSSGFFYVDTKTGRRVSQSTWKRSRAHGGTRYKRRSRKKPPKKNREYLIFLFNREKGKHQKKYLSSRNPSKWCPVTPAEDETEQAAEKELEEQSTSPRILVIYKKLAKRSEILTFSIDWIEEHLHEWQFIANELAGGPRQIVIAKGTLTSKQYQVIIGEA